MSAPISYALNRETICDMERAAILLNVPQPIVERWARRGKDGVKLESYYCRIRRKWVTSEEAVERFTEKVDTAA